MSNVDKFLQLFSDFEMVVEPVRERTLEKKTKVSVVQSSKSCSELRKSLKRLTTEYKRAQKSFRHNKISRQDLFDFEWRIFEIQEQIRMIEEDGETPNEY